MALPHFTDKYDWSVRGDCLLKVSQSFSLIAQYTAQREASQPTGELSKFSSAEMASGGEFQTNDLYYVCYMTRQISPVP